jgi:hypothetical protein
MDDLMNKRSKTKDKAQEEEHTMKLRQEARKRMLSQPLFPVAGDRMEQQMNVLLDIIIAEHPEKLTDFQLFQIFFDKAYPVMKENINEVIPVLNASYLMRLRSKQSRQVLITDDEYEKPAQLRPKIKLPIKQLYKDHHLVVAAPYPNYFQMDIVYCGLTNYLFIIEIGTRYLVAVAMNMVPIKESAYEISLIKKDSVACTLALEAAIKEFKPRKQYIIETDRELGFTAVEPELLSKYHIRLRIRPEDASHTRLSVVNRVVRTIRRLSGYKTNITPELMSGLVEAYNNTPHTTLLRSIGFPVSPIDVANDFNMEAHIALKAIHFNQPRREKNELEPGTKVNVHRSRMPFQKERANDILEGDWCVVERDRGNKICIQDRETGKVLRVPRFWVQPK